MVPENQDIVYSDPLPIRMSFKHDPSSRLEGYIFGPLRLYKHISSAQASHNKVKLTGRVATIPGVGVAGPTQNPLFAGVA